MLCSMYETSSCAVGELCRDQTEVLALVALISIWCRAFFTLSSLKELAGDVTWAEDELAMVQVALAVPIPTGIGAIASVVTLQGYS